MGEGRRGGANTRRAGALGQQKTFLSGAHVRGCLLPYLPARPWAMQSHKSHALRLFTSGQSNLSQFYFLTLDNAPVPENKKGDAFVTLHCR